MTKKESNSLLYGIGRHSGASATENAPRRVHHRENFLIYALGNPYLHSVILDASNHVSGFVFDCDSEPLKRLEAYRENSLLGSFPVDRPSSDVSNYVPHIANAKMCRFAFDLFVDSNATSYQLEVVYDDETSERLYRYEIAEIRSMQRWFNEVSKGLGQIPVPDSDLVYATQGIRDSKAYQDSIIPGIYTLKRYLIDSGVEMGKVGSILDFGCGTGRLLVGWYLDDPRRILLWL
jgi:hypothetical protein